MPNVTVTAPTFYTFKPDGTYTFKEIAGVDRVSTVKGVSGSSSHQTQYSGTYTVRDYTLTLTGAGTNAQHLIFRRQTLQSPCDAFRRATADARIDFVEHQCSLRSGRAACWPH